MLDQPGDSSHDPQQKRESSADDPLMGREPSESESTLSAAGAADATGDASIQSEGAAGSAHAPHQAQGENAAHEESAASEDAGHIEQPAEVAEHADSDESPEEEAEPVEESASVEPLELDLPAESEEVGQMDWYILKVQSNREETIRDALLRRVKIEGLERFFGDIIVPTEMVSEFKSGKKRVVKRKLYPGYIVVHMIINDDTWFLVRDTPGIGDFTGAAGKPVPMLEHEVDRLLAKQEDKTDEAPKLKIGFKSGDRVKINEGTFENFEGDVDAIDEANGRVTVMINIFGRSTPVELEYWQVESV